MKQNRISAKLFVHRKIIGLFNQIAIYNIRVGSIEFRKNISICYVYRQESLFRSMFAKQCILQKGGNKITSEKCKHEYFVLCINFFTICAAPMLRDVLPHQYVYYPINRCSSYNKHANNHVSSEEVMHLNGTCQ